MMHPNATAAREEVIGFSTSKRASLSKTREMKSGSIPFRDLACRDIGQR